MMPNKMPITFLTGKLQMFHLISTRQGLTFTIFLYRYQAIKETTKARGAETLNGFQSF